jgi:hypothetical protein
MHGRSQTGCYSTTLVLAALLIVLLATAIASTVVPLGPACSGCEH